jgi:hypothetical protein
MIHASFRQSEADFPFSFVAGVLAGLTVWAADCYSFRLGIT